jgi:hypothetical protein
MMTALKYTAIASAFLLTAGSAAFAQNYNQNPSQGPEYNQSSQSYNPSANTENQELNNQGFTGYGNQAYNPSMNQQGYNPGMQGSSGWNQGMQGSTWSGNQPYNSASGSGSNMNMNQQQVVQELRRYGYENLQDLRPMQGWSADAMRNGERVHIILGDNGEVATFQGRR